ncbi:hypothetical protein ScalyP_jg10616 [Parmales sp. scaly parma]|nr:hypothetical protein ScalyP_jg10616 [Parmales sp. scaly parma]
MLKRVITLLGHTGALTDLAPHPSSNYFASSGIDNTVRIWERVVNEDAGKGKGKGEGEEGKWLRKCKTILSDHRPSPGSELHPQMHSFPHRGVACVLFFPDGLSLATGGTDGRVFLYTLNLYEKEGFVFFDTAKTKTLICGGGEECGGAVLSMSFDPTSKRLVTSAGTTIKLWDIGHENKNKLGLAAPIPTQTQANVLKIKHGGNYTGGMERGHTYCVSYTPNGRVIVVAGHSRQVRFLNSRTLEECGVGVDEPVPTLPAVSVDHVCFTKNSEFMVSACGGKRLIISKVKNRTKTALTDILNFVLFTIYRPRKVRAVRVRPWEEHREENRCYRIIKRIGGLVREGGYDVTGEILSFLSEGAAGVMITPTKNGIVGGGEPQGEDLWEDEVEGGEEKEEKEKEKDENMVFTTETANQNDPVKKAQQKDDGYSDCEQFVEDMLEMSTLHLGLEIQQKRCQLKGAVRERQELEERREKPKPKERAKATRKQMQMQM